MEDTQHSSRVEAFLTQDPILYMPNRKHKKVDFLYKFFFCNLFFKFNINLCQSNVSYLNGQMREDGIAIAWPKVQFAFDISVTPYIAISDHLSSFKVRRVVIISI